MKNFHKFTKCQRLDWEYLIIRLAKPVIFFHIYLVYKKYTQQEQTHLTSSAKRPLVHSCTFSMTGVSWDRTFLFVWTFCNCWMPHVFSKPHSSPLNSQHNLHKIIWGISVSSVDKINQNTFFVDSSGLCASSAKMNSKIILGIS